MLSLRKFLVVLLSLGALALFAACAGEDGDDGRDGQDYTGGAVVDSGKKDYNATNNYDCIGCHMGDAYEFASPAYRVAQIAGGVAAADTAAKALMKGGAHYSSERRGCGGCHNTGEAESIVLENMLGFMISATVTPVTAAYGSPVSCVGCHGVADGHYAYISDFADVYGNEFEPTMIQLAQDNISTPDVDESKEVIAYSGNISATFNACNACHSLSEDDQHASPAIGAYFPANYGDAYTKGLHGAVIDHGDGNYFADNAAGTGNVAKSRGTCAICHTAAFAAKYNPMTGSKSDSEFFKANGVTSNAAFDYSLSAAPITCANCHDAHTGGLVTENVTLPLNNVTRTEPGDETAAYSAEFVLCTSCHVVKLDVIEETTYDDVNRDHEFNPGEKYTGEGFFSYYLAADTYGKMVVDTIISSSDASGHHGGSYFMNFATTHFKTAPATEAVTAEDSATGQATEARVATTAPTKVVPSGYSGKVAEVGAITKSFNVLPSSTRACTGCHDPHGTSKFGATHMVAFEGVEDDPATPDVDETVAPENTNLSTPTALGTIAQTWAESAHSTGGHFRAGNYVQKRCFPCHNGSEATTFMKQGAANAFGSTYRRGMQSEEAGYGSNVQCGTCHDISDTDDNNTLTGSLRTVALSNGGFVVNTGMYNGVANAAADATVPAALLVGMEESMVCLVCHAGSSRNGNTIDAVREGTDSASALTKMNKYNRAAYTSYSQLGKEAAAVLHRTEGALATGFGLIDVKGAADQALELLAATPTPFDSATGAASHGAGAGKYACIQCHEVDAESHTFRAFEAETGVWKGSCGGNCHGTIDMSVLAKTHKDNAIAALTFLRNALRVVGSDGKAVESQTGGSAVIRVFNGTAWVTDNNVVTDVWANSAIGAQRFAALTNLIMLEADGSDYLHAGTAAVTAIGQSLKAIYLDAGGVDTAAGFSAWLAAGVPTVGAATGNAAVTAVPAMDAAAATWLNATANYANW
jgi:cytochrome c2